MAVPTGPPGTGPAGAAAVHIQTTLLVSISMVRPGVVQGALESLNQMACSREHDTGRYVNHVWVLMFVCVLCHAMQSVENFRWVFLVIIILNGFSNIAVLNSYICTFFVEKKRIFPVQISFPRFRVYNGSEFHIEIMGTCCTVGIKWSRCITWSRCF